MRKFIALLFCCIFMVSCVKLTEENQNKLTANNQRVVKVTDYLKTLYASLKTIKEKLGDAYTKWKAGEISKADYEDLKTMLDKEKNSIEMSVKVGLEEVKQIEKDSTAIIDSGVPMWQVILFTVLGVGGAVAERHFKLKGARAAGETLGAAFGAVSRAYDAVVPAEGEDKSKIITAEIKKTPGLTADILEPLHHKATAGEL